MRLLRWIIKRLLLHYYRLTRFLRMSVEGKDGTWFTIESHQNCKDISRHGTRYYMETELRPDDAFDLMLKGASLTTMIYDPETRKFVVVHSLEPSSQNPDHNEHERSDAQE